MQALSQIIGIYQIALRSAEGAFQHSVIVGRQRPMYLITHRSRGGDWVTTAVAEVLQPCCSIRSRGRISIRSQTDVGGMSAVARLVDFCNVLPALLRLHCSVTALVCIGKTARRAHDVCFVVPVGLRTAVFAQAKTL